MSNRPWPLVASQVKVGGTPVVAAYGPMLGGYIINPNAQGIAIPEVLYVDIVNDAVVADTPTGIILALGERFDFPANFAGRVSVNAATSGHMFSGIVYQPASGFVPTTASFPPLGQTSLLSALPQYLYQEYADDEDLQAFVAAYNAMVQEYMDWFASVSLPVYGGLQGQLLDWVMAGLYGMARPALPTGLSATLGPLNTITMNSLVLNAFEQHGPQDLFQTTDDVFKRIATWYLYTGDGRQFNIRWIKRRVERFLTGENGYGGQTDQTYDVGITFGVNGQININLQSTRRFSVGGSVLNVAAMNDFALNEYDTDFLSIPISPVVPIFKAAVEAGVLKFPFQLTPVVNVN